MKGVISWEIGWKFDYSSTTESLINLHQPKVRKEDIKQPL